MPWCDACSRFWNPGSMNADGTCPSCGRTIAASQEEPSKAPWHFKLLLAAVILYLGWRAVELVVWAVDKL